MREIKVEHKSYHVFTAWEEVPTHKGCYYLTYLHGKAPDPEDVFRFARWQESVVFCLSTLPEEYIGKLPFKPFIEPLFNDLLDLLSRPLPQEPLREFTLNGVLYRCAEDDYLNNGELIAWGTATTEEMLEAKAVRDAMLPQRQAVSTATAAIQAEAYDQLPLLVAIMYRPQGERYTEQGTARRAELFRTLPFTTTVRAAFFLSRLSETYISGLLHYGKNRPKHPTVNMGRS